MKTYVCFALALLLPSFAGSQARPRQGEVSGMVRDHLGAAIDSARVIFTDVGTKQQTVAGTAPDGRYDLLLPASRYRIQATADSFQPSDPSEIQVREGQSSSYDFALDVSDYGDPIPVDSPTPITGMRQRLAPPEPMPTPGISVIKFVPPAYPAIAKTANISGDVRVLVEIASDGSAKTVTALSGHPMLKIGATDALKQWRFGCQRCDAPLFHIVTISFVIDDDLPGRCDGHKQQPLRCVEPDLPGRLIVRSNTPIVETMESIHDPVSRRRDWPAPISDSSVTARPMQSR
jgi:hypothetical protein